MPTIIEHVINTVDLQVQALISMRNRIDQSMVQAIDLMISNTGHSVVIGMGKSGIIAQKIASTLSSTGTPAFFVHPSEALHGDLGMIRPMDVVLLISNSGETDEILRIIPFLQQQNNKIIALTSKATSTLAKNAHVFLDVGVEKEACKNNLAPTSSTTCSLVMGDAIAVALSHARNFQPEDYARFHPGGSLGRKLLTYVEDVMHKNLSNVYEGTSISDALLIMTKDRLGVALITNKFGQLKGVFTDGDLRRALMKNSISLSDKIDDYMSSSPLTVERSVRLVEAEELMRKQKVRCLVVVDTNKKPIGLVELLDT